jgi:hypothetical protein
MKHVNFKEKDDFKRNLTKGKLETNERNVFLKNLPPPPPLPLYSTINILGLGRKIAL